MKPLEKLAAFSVLLLLTTSGLADDEEIKAVPDSADTITPEDKIFPTLETLFGQDFQAHVEFKRFLTLDTTVSVFVDEYHSISRQAGRLDLIMNNAKESLYYYSNKKQVVGIAGRKCSITNNDDSNFFSHPIYWGWIGDNSMIGPSAIFFRKTVNQLVWVNQTTVRGIRCNKFEGQDEEHPNVTLSFCVSAASWSSPGISRTSVPVEASAVGFDNNKTLVETITEITLFRQGIIDDRILKIPPSLGCEGLDRISTKSLPKFSNQFSYVVETYEKVKGSENKKSIIFLYKVWYQALEGLTKIMGIKGNEPFTEIQDFQTGVNYHISAIDQCAIGPIRNSIAEKQIGGFMTAIKNPVEFLQAEGDYYYLGQEMQRNINCDVFEVVKRNHQFLGMTMDKVVYTYYFTNANTTQSTIDGNENYGVPVTLQISAYPTPEVSTMVSGEYNYFRFDVANGDFYEEMNIENCFPEEQQKRHFLLTFPAPNGTSTFFKQQHKLTQALASTLIISQSKISPLRLPTVKVYYEPDKILVEGLILEKAPVSAGFYLMKDEKFPPTEGEKKMDDLASIDECAEHCLNEKSLDCKGFTTCKNRQSDKFECYLTSKDGSEGWGEPIKDKDKECSLSIKSVTTMNRENDPLDLAIKNLQSAVMTGSTTQLRALNEKGEEIIVTASRFEATENPFAIDKSEKYESVLSEMQLVSSSTSQTSLEVDEEVLSARECHDKCVKETSMSCASFSFCSNTKKCRLSSIYIGSKGNEGEVETGTNCQVYRKEALKFFEEYPGQTLRSRGVKSLNTISASDCAFACRNEIEFRCRGFDICPEINKCILTASHALDVPDAVNPSSYCKHYSMKYSTEYADMGRLLADDPKHLKMMDVTFEECARLCYTTEDFNCKSINYCPQLGEDRAFCELNTVATYDDGVETKESDPCQHYLKILKAPEKNNSTDIPFVPFSLAIEKGFQAHVEIKVKFDENNTIVIFVDEYHDLIAKRGRLEMISNPASKTALYYNAEKNEVAVISGGACKVGAGPLVPAFWGWDGNFSVKGPSGNLFRETDGLPKFNATITTDRGITCNLYDARDKIDKNVTIQYCISEDNWSSPGEAQKRRVPIFIKLSGKTQENTPVEQLMDFTFFKADKINPLFFKIPKGIGCQGLQPEAITKVVYQFSYVLEMYDKPIKSEQLHPKVYLYKVMYNNLEKLLIVNGITGDKPYKEIQDYFTGINYHMNEFDECKIGPIQESITAKLTAFSGELKDPKEFLSMDGDFYHIGQDLQRGIYCEIFESVKTDYTFMEVKWHKVVFTYFLSSSKVDSTNDGYTNSSFPVALQISLYLTSDMEKTNLIEYNYFRFDEGHGLISYSDSSIFYDGMNIENCFPDEEQKSHFLITFPTSEDISKAAKDNHKLTWMSLLFQIMHRAHVSYLRLPMVKLFYEPNKIMVEVLMLERPPITAGFYENKDSKFFPTTGGRDMTVVSSNDDCAANCLSLHFDFDSGCTGFTTCKSNRGNQLECYLTDEKNSSNPGTKILDKDCNLFFKSVTSETIREEYLKDAVLTIKEAANDKRMGVYFKGENDILVNFTSGSFETVENPFGFGKSEKFQPIIDGYQLLPHEGSQTSLEVGEVVSSARECHDKCVKETSLACAAFSFCPNQKRCRLSSIYVGSNNKDEVEIATDCKVYRTEALNYFDVFPGVTLPSKGYKTDTTIASASDCAFACRNDKTQTCRGFDFCSSPRQCVLTTSHALDFPVLQNITTRCKHYSLKYSTEFIDMGKILAVDPKGLKYPEVTLEQCAMECYMMKDFNCKSLNYCPQLGEDRAFCELNTVSAYDDGVETKESDPCQHYVKRALPDVPATVSPLNKIFFPLQDLITKGFETHVEVTFQGNINIFMNEYHNVELGQGRSDMSINGLRYSLYYFFDTEELVSISGSICHVSKYDETGFFNTPQFWGWIGNDTVIGPSAILFRDSVKKLEWVAEEFVRGVLCDKFEGFDKEHPKVKVAHWYTAVDWESAIKLAIRVPVKASAIGADNENNPVYSVLYFTLFRPGPVTPEALEIPRGLGCAGLSILAPSATLPKLKAQYSFEAEYYDMAAPVIRPNSKVSMYKIWHDGLGNLTKVIGTNTGDNLLFTEIHDFNTGINYRFNEVDICTIGPIITTGDRKALAGIVNAMKSPLEFLALDGSYYYMGMALQRGIDCHIWESVKTYFIITNEQVERAVYTYFFSTPKTEIVSDGDENLLIPVALQISVYENRTKTKFIEMNFFRFDEPIGRAFYDDIKIANCFMEESQKSYFSVNFQATPQDVLVAKDNHKLFENLASLAIAGAAHVSPLRLPYVKVYYEYDNIIILGDLVERPATIVGFYPKTDDPKILPTKGEKTAAVVSNDDGCATICVKEKSFACTGFSTCESLETTGKFECYLTSNDGTRPWGDPFIGKHCKLFLKAVQDAKLDDAFLNSATQLLQQKVFSGELSVLIQNSVTGEPVQFTASGAQIHLKPITFGDSEVYEELVRGKQLTTDSQTTLELQVEVLSARDCYDKCLKETSMSCGTFSYCSNRHKCSLSSLYLSKDDQKGEMTDGTDCNIYRKNALKFFEQYPGMTSATGTAPLKRRNPEDCAYACRNQTDITCRSFDFCEISKSCFLSESHGVKLSIQPNSFSCSHYSLKYSSEFVDKGHDIIVDSSAEIRTDLIFEECAKTCYENEKFKCLSFNYCPSQSGKAVCELSTKSTLDKNIITKRSDACQNYYRKDILSAENPTEIMADSKRVSNGAFAGALIGMLIFGMLLGVVGFMIFSYYKAKKAGEEGFTIRYTRGT